MKTIPLNKITPRMELLIDGLIYDVHQPKIGSLITEHYNDLIDNRNYTYVIVEINTPRSVVIYPVLSIKDDLVTYDIQYRQQLNFYFTKSFKGWNTTSRFQLSCFIFDHLIDPELNHKIDI